MGVIFYQMVNFKQMQFPGRRQGLPEIAAVYLVLFTPGAVAYKRRQKTGSACGKTGQQAEPRTA
jgi:hypothetical protein